MNNFIHKEKTICSEYLSDSCIEFKYIEIEEGTTFIVKEKKEKHLFFFLEGCVRVRYNEFDEKVFGAGEMIFIPKSADCSGKALAKSSFIVHTYDAPVKLCDRAGLNEIIAHSRLVQYEFKSLPICQTLNSFLLLLKVYLSDGMNCMHFNEIKQRELFMVFRTYYNKRDIAELFYPILGKSMDFRSKVMKHHTNVRTVKEFARHCGYSEAHFNELFVAEFENTPYQWMQKQKAKHIIGRLTQTEEPLKEIASEFNFTSQNHFNKYCKAQFGEPAARIRQKFRGGNQ